MSRKEHPKSTIPCRICNGKSKKPCCICGWKGAKEPKEKKEITRADRRSDFLGDIYNWMRKCRMSETAMIGDLDDEIVVIVRQGVDDLEIVDFVGRWIVPRSLVTNIRVNDMDNEIFERFGNPLSMDAKPYVRRYKKKKNEV